jgi:uracil-DNA glycosylase
MSSSKFYAVVKGHNPGIYTDWPTTNENVKGFSGAVYESFGTMAEAEQFIKDYNLTNPLVTTKPTTRLNTLNNKQLAVINFLLKGENIALMGAAGCGKSYLLSVIYEEFPGMKKRLMTSKYNGINGVVSKLPRIQMCALTGCAALLLGNKAKTLHSWAGIGLGKGSISELYTKIRRNQKAMRNWLCTDLLIIDEISMMTAELLDKLNQLAKKVRGNIKPFGGIQVIFVGDFYQLPPVNKSDDETRFAFESEAWKEVVTTSIELTEIKRQTDEVFQRVLKEARVGKLSRESCEILRAREGLAWRNNKIKPTLIFPRRAEVDMINDSNLRALTGRRYTYKARLAYDGKIPDRFSETDEGFLRALNLSDTEGAYVKELELILNAQVMLVSNIDPEKGLVNGSRGVVVGFCEGSELPIVEFVNGVKQIIGTHAWPIEDYEFVSRTQVPLRLAFAITAHKCVSEDTLLSIPGRGLIKIKDLECEGQEINTIYKPTNIYVSGLCENKEVIEVYKGNIEDGIKFTTTFGYELITSNRHPLLVFNKDTYVFEWKQSPNITYNDYIVLKKGTQVEGSYYSLNSIQFTKPHKKQINVPNYLNEDFGYFLGVMLGDGSISDKTYRFDLLGNDIDILEKCIDILDILFNIKVKLYTRNTNILTKRIFFHSKQLVELFKHIGYNFQKADKKEIPSCILTSPITVQKAVIRGLYDTDGGVSKNLINYTTTSYTMSRQVQQILLNIGIPASRNMMRDNITEKNWKNVFRLNISGKSALTFIKEVGFYCKRKIDMSTSRFYEKDTLRKNNKSQSFEIPNGDKLINNLRDEMRNGLKRTDISKITQSGYKLLSSIINKTQKLRCESLNMIVSEINNISQYHSGNILKFMNDNGILIDTIKNIEKNSNIQMYDIGVSPLNSSNLLPDGHDFIGNGFVNHNCQGSTLDSALVDIGAGIFEYGQAYVALSRVRSLDALFVHDFDPLAFKAHPKVKQFYKTVEVSEISPEDMHFLDEKNESKLSPLRTRASECLSAQKNDEIAPDSKAIITEMSKPIQAVIVNKMEETTEDKTKEIPTDNWLYESVPTGWKTVLEPCKDKLAELSTTLSGKEYLPAKDNIWRALELTPLSSIKVVILGQDPYPTPGNAHGLAFSVLPDVRPLPASLKNIYKELASDVGFVAPAHGNLEAWAKQGVLLLNTVLTVEAGAPQSHSKIGWEEVTDQIIRAIAAQTKNVVFVLWGKSAQVKKKLLGLFMDSNSHRVFESAHPSPLSATKGFFGSRPFSTVNGWLKEMGKEVVDWTF